MRNVGLVPNATEGGPGPDVITGDEGVDTLRDSGGLDALFSRDASADSVSCGEGPDALSVDAFDTLAPDCGMTSSPSPAPSGSPPRRGPERDGPGAAGARAAPVAARGAGQGPARGGQLLDRLPGERTLLANRATARRLGLRTGAASRTLGRLQPLALTAGSPRSTRVRLRRAWRHALLRARSARLALSARIFRRAMILCERAGLS
jgi:hypothetical protein